MTDGEVPTTDPLPSPDRDRSKINWARWFVIIGGIAGLAFALSLPMSAPADEANHFMRVSTIADGYLIPPRTYAKPDNYRLDGCVKAYWTFLAFRKDKSWRSRFRNPPCHGTVNARAALFSGIQRSEVYSPVPYVPAVIGYRIGRAVHGPSGSFFGARVGQLIGYLVVMAFAIRLLPWGKPFVFATALMPVLVAGSGGITTDAMTMAFSVLAVALTLRLTARAVHGAEPAHARELALLAASCVALGLSKSVYAPMALMAVTIPLGAFGSLRRKAAWVGGIIAATVVTTGAWAIGVVTRLPFGLDNSSKDIAASIQQHPGQFLTAIARTWTTPNEFLIMVGGIVAINYLFGKPKVGTALLYVIVTGLLVVRYLDPRPFQRQDTVIESSAVAVQSRQSRVLTALLALAVAAVSLLLIEYGIALAGVLYDGRYIHGVQGRYFLPLFPLCLFGINAIRYRPAHRWAVAWIPAAAILLNCWWYVTSVRFHNHWL